MTGGSARHGRRDNGLFAAAYAAVGDVDPRVGEHLLDVLGNRGIAAYLQPTADTHPLIRSTSLPSRPTDRLYVDRAEVDTAREFLDILQRDGDEPGPDPTAVAPAIETRPSHTDTALSGSSFEQAWASIVAGYGETADIDQQPSADEQAPSVSPRPETTVEEPSLLDALDTFGADLDDEDDVYHPPAPPPLPHVAGITIVAIIGIVAGLAVIAHPALLPIDQSAAAFLGCLALLGGAVVLIGRARSGKDDEPDDPSNGAII